jgi:hypothetical protein
MHLHNIPVYDAFVVDYVCPFSAKMAKAIDTVLKPLFDAGGQYEGKVKVIFRPQVQPWHASSTFVHEAGLAVRMLSHCFESETDMYTGRSCSTRTFLALLACSELVPLP